MRATVVILLLLATTIFGFVPPNKPPPRSSRHFGGFDADDIIPDDPLSLPRKSKISMPTNETDASGIRGGDAGGLVKGTKATLKSTSSFWKNALSGVTSTIGKPFAAAKAKFKSMFKSKEEKKEDELLEKLKTMNVLKVAVEDETILPKDVVYLTAKRAGVLNQPLANNHIQKFAEQIKEWYDRKGYVLHRVVGATLDADTATAVIQVQEPKVSSFPVDITFCKEMVIDQDTGNLMTFRQYKQRHQARRTFGFDKLAKDDLNTTFIPTDGRTRPRCVARALNLEPGKPFQWKPERWGSVSKSGVFKNVLRASPQAMPDGTVQFNLLVTESPSRHLEYGVAKSLYTDSWEGEVEFEHINLLGGGEKLGLNVRRGAKDAEPSVMVSFSDDHFGLEGGYDVEVFKDFIGDQGDEEESTDGTRSPPDHENDALLHRKGATLRVRNPIDTNQVKHSLASGSIEQIATKTGLHESLGSASLSVGPFDGDLSMGARWNVDGKCTLGTRFRDGSGENQGHTFTPYGAVSSTTRQIFPLLSRFGRSQRRILLAFQHSVTASTPTLPRHELKAQGVANKIRGMDDCGRAATAIRGTTEVRIPVDLPIETVQDSCLVLFGDWVFTSPEKKLAFSKQTCVGVGFRKSTLGLPLKYDLCYTSDGKVKGTFGLGQDFNV